jgi:hypothetical protein
MTKSEECDFSEPPEHEGTITVGALVRGGVKFILHGMITGDLEARSGALAVIHGSVNGAVINYGGRVGDIWHRRRGGRPLARSRDGHRCGRANTGTATTPERDLPGRDPRKRHLYALCDCHGERSKNECTWEMASRLDRVGGPGSPVPWPVEHELTPGGRGLHVWESVRGWVSV